MATWALLGVPMYTLAAYSGMGEGPRALRKAGVATTLGDPVDLGDVELDCPRSDVTEDGARNLENFKRGTHLIFDYTKMVATDQVLVVGGECSVTVGATAGLSRAFGGKAGMLWMDAHGDFNTPETSPSGYVGGMCLAMACGRGPNLHVWDESEGPRLAEERLVHVGSRDLDQPEVAAFNSSPAKLFTSQQVRHTGAEAVAEEAARHLDNRSDWVICHVDVDVVDPEVLPAVNYPTPGGLTMDETAKVVKALRRTGKLRVLEITSYNAAKDPRGDSAKEIIGLLKEILV